MRYRFLLPLLLLLPLHSHAQAEQGEELHYRLSYSGLITGYLWKELADVTLRLTPEPVTFLDAAASHISMDVTTAGYHLAETVHPLRYHWQSTLSPDLKRSQLVEVVDEGQSDIHEIFWYDWKKNLIAGFRKRQQLDVAIPLFDDEPVMEWEKDYLPPAPAFLAPRPPVAPGLGYLLRTTHLAGKLNRDAIDPLAMLLQLRRHDFKKQGPLELQIVIDDEVAPYQARLIEQTTMERRGCSANIIKVEVRRSDESGEDGVMTLWLSDDPLHLPLRIDVDAPLGMLHVDLHKMVPAPAEKRCIN